MQERNSLCFVDVMQANKAWFQLALAQEAPQSEVHLWLSASGKCGTESPG